MNAYNKLNGEHCSESKALLNRILREEWGYDGTVISDWGSVHTTVQAAESALDMEMSVTTSLSVSWEFAAKCFTQAATSASCIPLIRGTVNSCSGHGDECHDQF